MFELFGRGVDNVTLLHIFFDDGVDVVVIDIDRCKGRENDSK